MSALMPWKTKSLQDVPPDPALLLEWVAQGRLNPEEYPGQWEERRRHERRRHRRRGVFGWSFVLAAMAVFFLVGSVAVTAGGLVAYAGYTFYQAVEGGKSMVGAGYDLLFSKPEDNPKPQGRGEPPEACRWADVRCRWRN